MNMPNEHPASCVATLLRIVLSLMLVLPAGPFGPQLSLMAQVGNAAGPSDAPAPQDHRNDSRRASQAHIPAGVARDMSKQLETLDRLRNDLERENGFLRQSDDVVYLLLFNRVEGTDLLRKRFERDLKGSGGEIPQDYFVQLEAKVDALWQEIYRMAPTYFMPPGSAADEKLTEALEQKIKASAPTAQIMKSTLQSDQWKIKRNALGIPASRSVKGVVLYRMPGQEWYVCREFVVQQQYFRRSDKPSSNDISLGALRFQLNE